MKRIIHLLPKNQWGDYLHCLLKFYVAHRRLPKRNSGLFNDYLFFDKTSHKPLDILRQLSSDKQMVKGFSKEIVPEIEYPRTLRLIDSVQQLGNFDADRPCVIKPSHSNGDVIFLETGGKLSVEQISVAKRALARNIYNETRQRNYRYLRHRLICEEMLPDGQDIVDYKCFCFEGNMKLVQVDTDRHRKHSRSIYTREWTQLDLTYNFPRANPVPAPTCLGKMIHWAEQIASQFEFARIDFYISGGRLLLGEVTHCPEAAHGRFGSIAEEMIFSRILFERNTVVR